MNLCCPELAQLVARPQSEPDVGRHVSADGGDVNGEDVGWGTTERPKVLSSKTSRFVMPGRAGTGYRLPDCADVVEAQQEVLSCYRPVVGEIVPRARVGVAWRELGQKAGDQTERAAMPWVG